MTRSLRGGQYPNPELRLIDALRSAGVNASDKRLPDDHVLVWLIDTRGRIGGGRLEATPLEVESWAREPDAAWAQLSEARRAAATLVGVQGIRTVEEIAGPSSKPTGEQGWERYRMQIEILGPTY